MERSNKRGKGTKRGRYVIGSNLCVIRCGTLGGLKLEKCLLHRQLHATPFWCSLKMLRWRREVLVLASGDLFVVRRHAVSGDVFCKLGISDVQIRDIAGVDINQRVTCINLFLKSILEFKEINLPLAALSFSNRGN